MLAWAGVWPSARLLGMLRRLRESSFRDSREQPKTHVEFFFGAVCSTPISNSQIFIGASVEAHAPDRESRFTI